MMHGQKNIKLNKYLCIQLPKMLLKVTIELLAVWTVHTQLHKFIKNGTTFFALSISNFIVSAKIMGLIVLVGVTASHTQL